MVVEVEVKSDLGSGTYPPNIVLQILAVFPITLHGRNLNIPMYRDVLRELDTAEIFYSPYQFHALLQLPMSNGKVQGGTPCLPSSLTFKH